MKALVKRGLARAGYRIEGTRMVARQLLDPRNLRPLEFDDIVCRRIVESGPALSFVQVGAFDGVVQDPLRKYINRCGWKGVLVEPQAGPAARLRELYDGNENIVVLQAAIFPERGARPLFTVDAERAPPWAGALASFDVRTILKHADLIPGLEGMIRQEMVDCITFDEVLSHLPAQQLDLLQVDTEGADALILSLFPFERIAPAVVHWEVRHLTKEDRERCFERLLDFGYRLAPSGTQDMLAVLS